MQSYRSNLPTKASPCVSARKEHISRLFSRLFAIHLYFRFSWLVFSSGHKQYVARGREQERRRESWEDKRQRKWQFNSSALVDEMGQVYNVPSALIRLFSPSLPSLFFLLLIFTIRWINCTVQQRFPGGVNSARNKSPSLRATRQSRVKGIG